MASIANINCNRMKRWAKADNGKIAFTDYFKVVVVAGFFYQGTVESVHHLVYNGKSYKFNKFETIIQGRTVPVKVLSLKRFCILGCMSLILTSIFLLSKQEKSMIVKLNIVVDITEQLVYNM